jgi:hypothetical protein
VIGRLVSREEKQSSGELGEGREIVKFIKFPVESQ